MPSSLNRVLLQKYSLAGLLFFVVDSAQSQTNIYKCVDERGKPFLTNLGGQDCKRFDTLSFPKYGGTPKLGMTKEEITGMWGKPVRSKFMVIDKGTVEALSYENGITLGFINNQLEVIQN